jgi:NADP-dependent aldehyde dehydrogenase
VTEALAALHATGEQTMLTDGIAEAFRKGRDHMTATVGVDGLLVQEAGARGVRPNLLSVAGADFLRNPNLAEEVFGPLGLIVRAKDAAQLTEIAGSFKGQLTCTLHLDAGDTDLGQCLIPVLSRKAGRVLANGFPTGVEVADAMVHGGPYPASTNFGATSVGTLSIRRWLRPVCYQNMPEALLPEDLR